MKRIIKSALASANAWGVIANLVRVGGATVVTPLALSKLPSDNMGFWYLLTTAAMFAALAELGMTSALTRFVACSRTESRIFNSQGYEKTSSSVLVTHNLALSVCRNCYLLIACTMSIVLSLAMLLTHAKWADLPGAKWVTIAYVAMFFAANAQRWRIAFYIGVGETLVAQKATVYGYLGGLLITTAMLLLGGGVSSLIFSQMAPPLIISLILRGRMFEYDSGSAKPSSREQFRCVRAIAPNSLRSAAVNVSAFAVNHVNTLLLVKHTSLSEVASYGLLNQITMMVFGFGWVLQTNITAKMVKLRESGDCEGLVQTFGLQWFRGMLIYVASASVCAVFLGPVMALIQSQTHAPKVETILLLFAFRANEFSLACFGWLLMSENRVPFPGLTVATSFIGVFLAWEGLATFGLNGMIVGSGVSNAMLSFFFYPAGTKSIRTTFPKFAKESIVIFLQSLRLLLNRPRGY